MPERQSSVDRSRLMTMYAVGEASNRAQAASGPAGASGARGGRAPVGAVRRFQHEALFYSGEDEFLAATVPLIAAALRQGQPVLVAVAGGRIGLLREALADRASSVDCVDMCALGRNPARMIPAWRQFLEQRAPRGQPALGIGEPVWPGRSAAELTECERHECLLNLAFASDHRWRLLCTYDLDGLDRGVIEAARRSHPYVRTNGASSTSGSYRDAEGPRGVFAGELPGPPLFARQIAFSCEQLRDVRHLVAAHAADALLAPARCEELVLAVSEVAANSVRHGGGTGTLRVWQENETLLCEVRDGGRIRSPLAGRVTPRPDQLSGRGLWLANQLCDLVQIRSDHAGTVVRLHMDLTASAVPT